MHAGGPAVIPARAYVGGVQVHVPQVVRPDLVIVPGAHDGRDAVPVPEVLRSQQRHCNAALHIALASTCGLLQAQGGLQPPRQ